MYPDFVRFCIPGCKQCLICLILCYVDGYTGNTGNFALYMQSNTPAPTQAPVTLPPVSTMEDGCADAAPLSVPEIVSGTTVGETVFQTRQCESAYELRTPGKWYTVEGTGETLFASLCGSSTDYDTMVSCRFLMRL